MKQIEPINSWINGQSVTATILNTFASNVTLGISATFYYGLLDENLSMVAQGGLNMIGEDYAKWGANDQYAWEFVATSLNLTIIGDYIPPVIEVPQIIEEQTNTI
jgi:hypothetical protein